MQLLEILRTDKWVTSGGKNTSAPIGLFECPSCKGTVEKVKQAGLKARSCGSAECRKATFQANPHNKGKRGTNTLSSVPYYSTLKERYRQASQKYLASEDWNTFNKFFTDMQPSYAKIRELSVKVYLDVQDGKFSPETSKWRAVSELAKYKKTGDEHSKFLYLVESQGFVKIGVTNDVQGRVSTISTCNPFEVKVILAQEVGSAYQVEKFLHDKFKDTNVRGEWFKLTSNDIAYITEHLSSL